MSSIQRRFGLLLGAALVVTALVAPSAMATITVKDAGGTLCSDVKPAINKASQWAFYERPAYESGGCTVHMSAPVSQPDYTILQYNTLERQCRIDYDLHVSGDGWGYINNVVFNGSSEKCGQWRVWSPGTLVVGPGDVNPNNSFPDSNASTEFNVLTFTEGNGIYGWVPSNPIGISLDVTAGSPLNMTNQHISGKNFARGKWIGNAGLIVTH